MKKILTVLILIIGMVAFSRPVAAFTVYHAGYQLADIFGTPTYAYGTAATISMPQPTILAGDTLALWIGMDISVNFNHYWVQAGYVVGVAPDGKTYTQPEVYMESQGNSYLFQPIMAVNWGTSHDFRLWDSCGSCTTPYVSLTVDGGPPTVVAMPAGWKSGTLITDSLEVQVSSSCCDNVAGSFSNLQIYSCGLVGQSCWGSWSYFNIFDSPPYYVNNISSSMFNVFTQFGINPGPHSVAYGTLITMADGRAKPVQNLLAGDQILVYNVPTGFRTTAVIVRLAVITTNTTITLHTAAGLPLRADASPLMRLWVLTNNGPVQIPIAQIQPGDKIYNYDLHDWVTVTDVTIASGGQHILYDPVYAPAMSNGLLLEFIANGYPDAYTI